MSHGCPAEPEVTEASPPPSYFSPLFDDLTAGKKRGSKQNNNKKSLNWELEKKNQVKEDRRKKKKEKVDFVFTPWNSKPELLFFSFILQTLFRYFVVVADSSFCHDDLLSMRFDCVVQIMQKERETSQETQQNTKIAIPFHHLFFLWSSFLILLVPQGWLPLRHTPVNTLSMLCIALHCIDDLIR